jgi:hypothetical protein
VPFHCHLKKLSITRNLSHLAPFPGLRTQIISPKIHLVTVVFLKVSEDETLNFYDWSIMLIQRQTSVAPNCTITLFARCGKKLKLIADGGDSGSKKCKQGYGGASGGGGGVE